MINELPTVFDIVTGKKLVKDKPAVNNNSGSKAKSTTKVVSADRVVVEQRATNFSFLTEYL